MMEPYAALPVSSKDYYDSVPSADQYSGDIWSDIPSFGILPLEFVTGLVVTPACDLANRKAETITLLPVLPIHSYLSSISFLPELKRSLEGQLSAGGMGSLLSLPPGYIRPTKGDLTAMKEMVTSSLSESGLSAKARGSLARAVSGIDLLGMTCTGSVTRDSTEKVKHLMGDKAFGDLLSKIVRNGYRLDLHFLPSDEQKREWAGVAEHSVALFRYPVTVPTELLDLAQATREDAWTGVVDHLSPMYPCADRFSRRPLKRLRVRPRFMSDLLTRFTAVFSRLGSPDFTDNTVARYVKEMGGAS